MRPDSVRIIYRRDDGGWWAESPTSRDGRPPGAPEVRALAIEGIPFALGVELELEHFVPAGEQVAA